MSRGPLLFAPALCLLTACGGDSTTTPTVAPAIEPPEATAPPAPPREESAFDSNQWNSAVGSSGGLHTELARHGANSESYASVAHAGFAVVGEAPLSTFGADVDTASFHNVRRMLRDHTLPPVDAVRIEEFVNACRYDLDEPDAHETFAFDGEIAPCPWQPDHELVRLSLRTRAIDHERLPPCNLVFLLDVSGSMRNPNKLPLLQRSMALLLEQLRPQDRISIVTYAAGVRVVLDSACGDDTRRILDAVQALRSGGGTNGEGGIQKAYELAAANTVTGVNRVILATDGDFNIGIQEPDALERFIEGHKQTGVFLTVLGFGEGNLKDDRLERLADKGNGAYHYIDDLHTARRVLIESFGATMVTLAKDVKLQTEWDPKQVARYRLLGYENRALEAVEFRSDQKDGGEVGAGHAVTAIYQIERLRCAAPPEQPLVTLRVRYKPPHGDTSREVAHAVPASARRGSLSRNGHVAATAAGLGLLLRGDDHLGTLTEQSLLEMARSVDRQRNDELVLMIERLQQVLTGTTNRAGPSAR